MATNRRKRKTNKKNIAVIVTCAILAVILIVVLCAYLIIKSYVGKINKVDKDDWNITADSNEVQTDEDGNIITKRRYLIPFHAYTIELDVFEGLFEGIVVAEVEFPSIEEAESFAAPEWIGEDVTYDGRYHNSAMSRMKVEEIVEIQSLLASEGK